VLSEEEIARLLKAARESKSPYLYCIILISLTTGARQGEILNLDWRHIDFENQIAYIKESKNGRPRSIALCNMRSFYLTYEIVQRSIGQFETPPSFCLNIPWGHNISLIQKLEN
jgi:site-specific recombinase XerD